MLAICAVYAIAYTSNLSKHGTFLKYCAFVGTSYVNKLVLTSEHYNNVSDIIFKNNRLYKFKHSYLL